MSCWVCCSFLVWLHVLLCSPVWSEPHSPFAAASWMLGSQVRTCTASWLPFHTVACGQSESSASAYIQWKFSPKRKSLPPTWQVLPWWQPFLFLFALHVQALQPHYFSSRTLYCHNAFCKMSTAFKCILDTRPALVHKTINSENKALSGFLLFRCSSPGLCFQMLLRALLVPSGSMLLRWDFAIDQFLGYRLTVKVALWSCLPD